MDLKTPSLLAAALLMAACTEASTEATPAPTASPAVDVSTPSAPSQPEAGLVPTPATPADAAAPASAPEAGAIQAAAPVAMPAPKLPANWKGTGVLVTRTGKLPRGAPKWARVSAEVIERKGSRYLVATGEAEKIQNPELARRTAENRARSELTRWTLNERLVGCQVVDTWRHARSGLFIARAELPVPAEWQPGQRLDSPPIGAIP